MQRTAHRAGVIKIATDTRFHDRERRLFAAAAATHRRTGAPVLTHTEQGTLGLEQVDLLRTLGVDLRHVVLSHLDRQPDPAYHRAILASGVRVEYDSAFRGKPGAGNPTLDLVIELLRDFPDQISMLGMDAARRGYWTSYGVCPGSRIFSPTWPRSCGPPASPSRTCTGFLSPLPPTPTPLPRRLGVRNFTFTSPRSYETLENRRDQF